MLPLMHKLILNGIPSVGRCGKPTLSVLLDDNTRIGITFPNLSRNQNPSPRVLPELRVLELHRFQARDVVYHQLPSRIHPHPE